jgi:hypothetical protein
MTNVGTIHLDLAFTGHERDMRLKIYVWDATGRNIISALEVYEENETIMGTLGPLRVRDALNLIFSLHPGAEVEFHISPEARNALDRKGRLKKIEAAFTMAAIAA